MPPHLLPDPAHVRLAYLCASDDQITVIAFSKATDARCPLCDQPSQRVHSRYIRTLADVPWQGVALQIRLTVRRFFCSTTRVCILWSPRYPGRRRIRTSHGVDEPRCGLYDSPAVQNDPMAALNRS